MKQIAAGVWHLEGFPPNLINVYLVEDVLIDAATRWAGQRILSQLRNRRLKMVALTHCHPDHQGAARLVCRRRGVPLACHEGDVDVMEGRKPMMPHNRIIQALAGVWSGRPYRVSRILREGDEVAGFRVLHAPGHTAGHVIYFRESDRVAIAGDLMRNMTFMTMQPQLHLPPDVFTIDPAQNRRSVRRLLDLQPSVICFGHGPPLRSLKTLADFVARVGA